MTEAGVPGPSAQETFEPDRVTADFDAVDSVQLAALGLISLAGRVEAFTSRLRIGGETPAAVADGADPDLDDPLAVLLGCIAAGGALETAASELWPSPGGGDGGSGGVGGWQDADAAGADPVSGADGGLLR